MRVIRTPTLTTLAVLALLTSCQGILGIEDATLRQENVSGAGGSGGSGPPGVDGGERAIVGDSGAGGEVDGRLTYRPLAETIAAIVVGSDQNFWLAVGDAMLRVTTRWEVTAFPVPEGFSIEDMALGSDGNVWYCRSDVIGRMTPSGGIEEYCIAQGSTTGGRSDRWRAGARA